MNVNIYESAKIINIDNIEFGDNIIIDDFVFIYAKSKIKLGNYVHIACYASITGGEYFEMKDFSAISQGVRILTATDDFKFGGFGNSSLGNSIISEEYRNVKRAPIIIGKFCVIGANSVILPGVNIGEGTTIGANSVVSRNIEPWGVYIGNKRIGERNKDKVLENYNEWLNNNIV